MKSDENYSKWREYENSAKWNENNEKIWKLWVKVKNKKKIMKKLLWKVKYKNRIYENEGKENIWKW